MSQLQKLISSKITTSFFEDEEVQVHYQEGNIGSDVDFYYLNTSVNASDNGMSDLPLIQIIIEPSFNKRIITRKYEQLSDVVGKIGGLLSVSKTIGSMFLAVFTQVKMIRTFVSQLNFNPMRRRTKKNDEKKKNRKPSKLTMDLTSKIKENENFMKEKTFRENQNLSFSLSIPISSQLKKNPEIDNSNMKFEKKEIRFQKIQKVEFNKLCPKNLPSEINCIPTDSQRNEDLLKKLEKFKFEINDKKENSDFSYWSYLKTKLKRNFGVSLNLKEKSILQSEQTFKRETDVLFILKRFTEIEKMKSVLFTKQQQKLFEFIKLPQIYVDDKKAIETDERKWQNKSLENSEKDMLEILKSYEEKMKKNESEITEIDKRILEILMN